MILSQTIVNTARGTWRKWKLSSHLKSICLSMRLAVATLGRRLVERECSSRFEEISWVVISVSAAVPAPQQLHIHTHTKLYWSTSVDGEAATAQVCVIQCSLDVRRDVVDLRAVLICYNHSFSCSCISSQNHAILKMV